MKLKKLNKKGFSLVEIIAAVAILGILSVIGIVSVNNIIQKGKEEHYKSAEKTLRLSAESYAQANRSYLPKNVGDTVKVTLRTLVDNNYTEAITDYYDNACDLDESYVQIFKYSKTDYSYLTYLNCPEWSNVEENNELKPDISITMTSPTDNTVKKTTAKTVIKDSNKILSYSITIYKNGNEVYTTGNVEANYETEITKTKDISSYTPGTIKVVAKATNIYGQTTTKTEEKTYTDRQGPACIVSVEDSTRDNDDWIAADREITVGCDDGEEGSGCTREEFTKTFKTDAKTGTITISDKAGNTTDCEVDVYVDKTPPSSCAISKTGTIGNESWYVTNVDLELTATDDMSGIRYKSLTTSASAPTSASGYNDSTTDTQTETKEAIWYAYVEDYAGNKTDCDTGKFKVDTTPPTAPTGGAISVSGSNKNASVTAVTDGTDATSGVKESRYLILKNNSTVPANTNTSFTTSRAFTRACGTTYYAYAITVDKAGNISTVHTIGTAADNANEYVNYSACSAVCDGGTKTASNECALITAKDTKTCNSRACCTSSTVRYVETTTCSADCDGGNYKRKAYSTYFTSNTHRCSSYDDWNGGSCNEDACYVEPEPEPEPETPVYDQQCYAYIKSKSGTTVYFTTSSHDACAIDSIPKHGSCTISSQAAHSFYANFGSNTSCSFKINIQGIYKWGGSEYNYISWKTEKKGDQYCTDSVCVN